MSSVVVLVLSILTCFGASTSAQEAASGPNRGAFTLLLNLGLGYQRVEALGGGETGLAGLNLGIGSFIEDNVAVMFRFSSTNVSYGTVRQVSGVGGPSVQYWFNDRVNIEGGIGFGFWDQGPADIGLGLILGAGYAFFNRGKHNLYIGFEYALAFTDPNTVHNIGIVFGYQLRL